MHYITLEDIKKVSGIVDSTEAESLRSELTHLIDISLWGSLATDTKTRRIDGNWSQFLCLERPVVSVSSIRVGGNSYDVDFIDGMIVSVKGYINKGIKNVEITYTVGYSECPDDFALYFKEYIRQSIKKRDEESSLPVGIKNKKIGDLSVTFMSPQEMILNQQAGPLASPEMQAIFNKYKAFWTLSTL